MEQVLRLEDHTTEMKTDEIWVPPLTPAVQDVLREARIIANQERDKFVRLKHLETALRRAIERQKITPPK